MLETPEGETGAAAAVPIVEATGVSKRYGATVALSDARLRVLPGELHALVGRNGAGKSTLVGILTGLREPDSGEIRFHGEPAPAIADREGWRRRVACVYQHSTIIPGPYGCRKPVHQPAAASARLHQLEHALARRP